MRTSTHKGAAVCLDISCTSVSVCETLSGSRTAQRSLLRTGSVTQGDNRPPCCSRPRRGGSARRTNPETGTTCGTLPLSKCWNGTPMACTLMTMFSSPSLVCRSTERHTSDGPTRRYDWSTGTTMCPHQRPPHAISFFGWSVKLHRTRSAEAWPLTYATRKLPGSKSALKDGGGPKGP